MSRKVVCAFVLAAALSIPAEIKAAEGEPLLHQGPWPIQDGFDRQPTEDELRASHQQDVTPNQAHEIDRLYDQLMSSSQKILGQDPAYSP